MTDELIKRLRNTETLSVRPHVLDKLTDEAADLIEQQAARITELETKCRLYEASLDKLDREADGLRAALARIKELVGLQNNEAWKDERNTDWSRGRILGIVGDALAKQQENG